MTQRGDRTRARLIEATLAVVGEGGYARASTRAIAQRAGVAEGTIYRHFPDKTALFFAAALEPNEAMLEWIGGLPTRAGTRSVEANLAEALGRLAELVLQDLPQRGPRQLADDGDGTRHLEPREALGAVRSQLVTGNSPGP